MDEKYQSALNKILKLASENKEFGDALKAALCITKATHNSDATLIYKNNQIDSIEHYLGLDYTVDTQESTVDYSFVADSFAYRQLVSDNREMMRFRYGTRYHKTDFLEFCRFALLQAEMLVNLFYGYNNATIETIKQRIANYTTNVNLNHCSTLESIGFGIKFWAICSELNINIATSSSINNVKQIRNEQSHRTIIKEDFSIAQYQEWLKQLHMPLTKNGEVNCFAIRDNTKLQEMYENQIKKTDEYKTYCFLLWCNRQPFNEVQLAIANLAKSVADNLLP